MSTPTPSQQPNQGQHPFNLMQNGQHQLNFAQQHGRSGDPGPSSQQHHQQQQPQYRPGMSMPPPSNMNPQQIAVLQQMAQSRGPNGQPQWTQEQLQAAMQAMQAGGAANPQTVIQAAMRLSNQQQQQQQLGQGQPPQMQQQRSGSGQGQFQQNRVQQLMQGQQNPSNPSSPAAPMTPSTPAQMALQGAPQMGRPGMMPPPPVPPGVNPQQQQQQQRPPSGQPTLSLSLGQQQQFTVARQNLMQNPQFQGLPPQQQHAHLMQMQQHMMRQFALQNGQMGGQQQQQPGQPGQIPHQQQVQLQQQQQQQQQSITPSRPESAQGVHQHQQSPNLSRQQPPGQPPLSSLPQHMVPRPGSAASQRPDSPHQQAGSPVVQQMMSTPPPPPPPNHMFVAPPPSAPSPATSIHSQHSHHTPQPSGPQPPQPQPSASPHSIPAGTPTQQGQYVPGMHGQPPQTSTPQRGGPPNLSQQHAQNAQNLLHSGQLSNLPQAPQAMPMNLQNLSQQQQQQLGSAMNIFNSAAQAQQQIRPPPGLTPQQPQQLQQQIPQQMIRPPNIDVSDFPFDWRWLPQLHHLQDPNWRNMMQARNPALLNGMQNAANLLTSGGIRNDIFHRMQQMCAWQKMQQQAQQGGQMAGMQQQPQPQIGRPPLGQAIPPHLQQQGFRPPPPGQAWPTPPGGVPRPPPPHLAPGLPSSPAVSDVANPRRSSTKDKSSRGGTPSQGPPLPGQETGHNMPPPAWIPSHGRPPPDGTGSIPPSALPAAPAVPVKEWESHLRLDLPITSITTLPDESDDPTFGGALPALGERDKENVKSWMDKDILYAKGLDGRKENIKNKMIKWAKNNDMDTPWWSLRKGERGRPPSGRLTVLWPNDKTQLRARTTHKGRKEFRFSATQLKAMASVEDHVVPVRLDLEHDQFKVKDTFMWNCADTVVTPDIFAQSLCDDFGVPPQHFHARIVAAINERVREYQDQVLPILTRSPDLIKGKLEPTGEGEGKAIWEVFRRVRDGSVEIKTDSGHEDDDHIKIVNGNGDGEDGAENGSLEVEEPMSVEEAMACLPPDHSEELRILIKVDIIVGTQNLTDTFEWDLNSTVSPEEFATSHVKELGLSAEFATALAHDIHEQLLVHKRSLFLVGHTPGAGYIHDDEVRSAFLPPLSDGPVLRTEDVAMSYYTPIFATYSEEDISQIEKERERDSKRKKRATRARRGIILPDREPLKTHRSLVNPVGPNGLAPTAAAADPTPAPVTSSRRAAAIAAQANINLLAQDLPLPQPPSPPPAPLSIKRQQQHRQLNSRNSRGVSRASPSSTREESVFNELSTPSVIGAKRSLREDSITDTIGGTSPLPPHKKRNGGRVIDSPTPELDTPVKEESQTIKVEELPRPEPGSGFWHCKNCGVPEHLAGGIRKDPKTNLKTMCGTCSRHLVRTGKRRKVEYNEDADYHRQRVEAGRRKPAPFERGGGGGDRDSLNSSQPPDDDQDDDDKSPPSTAPPSATPTTITLSTKKFLNNDTHADNDDKKNDDDDDDDSSSSDSDSDDDDARPPKVRISHTPVRTVSASGAITSPGTIIKKAGVEPPAWIPTAHQELSKRYPNDEFSVVPKAKPADQPHAPQEWRIKCLDCPGKVYTLGPGETFQNFEVHLKNRAHVEKRQARTGKP